MFFCSSFLFFLSALLFVLTGNEFILITAEACCYLFIKKLFCTPFLSVCVCVQVPSIFGTSRGNLLLQIVYEPILLLIWEHRCECIFSNISSYSFVDLILPEAFNYPPIIFCKLSTVISYIV